MTPGDWAAVGASVTGAMGLLWTIFAYWHGRRPHRPRPPDPPPNPGPKAAPGLTSASEELTAQRRYKSRRLSLDPPTYESVGGGWRVTKLERHEDPRFSVDRPCLLERVTNGQRVPVDFYASADAALAVAAALDGRREMPVEGLPRDRGEQAPARADAELSTRGAYFSRRVSADPPSYVTRNGRWRETKVPRHDDPRFSASRPWMLEQADGQEWRLVDFYATSDLAFVVAAALDSKQVMPIGMAPRPASVRSD